MLLRRFVLRPSRTCGAQLPARRGGVTPLAVLSLSLLVGIIALAIDGGTLMEERRHVQAAADAAAMAAAADLYSNYSTNQGTDPKGTAQASALANALANGFSNDGVQSTVTVNISPSNYQGGPNASKPLPAGYVEVIIRYNAGRAVSNIFGSGDVPVRGRAVARGTWVPHNNQVLLLNLTASSALSVSGFGSLKINGALQVNSSSYTPLALSGGGLVFASQYNFTQDFGGVLLWLLSILKGLGESVPPVNVVPPAPDPLRYLPAPDPVSLGLASRGTNLAIAKGCVDLYPGVYSGGISVSSGAKVVLHANADGTPGIYYLQGGGLQVTGSSTSLVTDGNETAGVLIYNDWSRSSDTIDLSCSGTLSLSPPNSGVYKGISIFQKRGSLSAAAPNITFAAQSDASVSGTIYAAYANLSLKGGSSTSVLAGQIIADTMSVSGTANVNVNAGTQPIANTRAIGLVE